MSKSTFALRNFNGQPVQHVIVTSEDLTSVAPAQVKTSTHHIIIIDRSGSMYCDLPDTKAMVEKLLTLTEFNDPDQKISLLSYSSQGDVKLHFAKVTVEDVLKADSPYLKEVRSIQVTGLTCISQSLTLATSLVDNADTTCITLHTDGYANDRSPSAEKTAIAHAVEILAGKPNVFVNTIAYRDWCDFTLLSSISNAASGVCVQAKNIRQVYDALHAAQATLASNMSPATMLAKAGDYTVFCSTSAGKVLGSEGDLTVRGLKAADDKTAYRFEMVAEAEIAGLPEAEPRAALAYARAQISEGNINVAKYALCGVRSALLGKHFRALVAAEVAVMAADIEAALFSSQIDQSVAFGLAVNGEWADVLSFDLNRNTATVNMLTARKANLVKCATSGVISEVAGLDISDLKDFRNYTVVGDGSICTPILPLRITDKRCHKALSDLGVITGDFDPNAEVNIELGKLALIGFDKKFSLVDDVYDRLCKLTAVSKILNACIKEASDAFTPEQVAELKAHYLSSALYFSGPTTTHYADLAAALNKGEVDTRLSYKIDVGNAEITALGKLPSANAFLDRRFTLTVNGQTQDKPKMTSVLDRTSSWSEKVLGPRIKLTKVDDLLFPIFKSFLIDGGKGAFEDTLRLARISEDTITEVMRALAHEEDKINAFMAANREMTAALDSIYHAEISPLVFYIGATGLVPDDLNAKAYTADQIVSVYPEIALSKDEKEGLFYVLPNGLILTVFIKGEYFTTPQANA